MQFHIRKMQQPDAPAVNLLSAQLGYALPVEKTAGQIRHILLSEDHVAFVAVTEEKIIGWIHAFKALYIESLPFVEVGGLGVEEGGRSKGVGRELIESVKQWCREQEVFTLRLRTQVKRWDAHRFYRALAFEEIKEQKVFQLRINSA